MVLGICVRPCVGQTQLLLLDEPSLGLAPLLVQEVLRIVDLVREMGRTALLVEQNANGALRIADRAYLMEVGNAHTWIGRVPGRISTDDIMIPGGVIIPPGTIPRRPGKAKRSSRQKSTVPW